MVHPIHGPNAFKLGIFSANADINAADAGVRAARSNYLPKIDLQGTARVGDDIDGDESPYGVIGMGGNVSEWTADWTPDNRFPIIKGGNFSQKPKTMAERIDNHDASQVQEWIGFRTVTRTAPAAK